MDAGLESLQVFHLFHQQWTKYLAGDMEKSRLSDVKVAFIIGLNEGVLPKKFSEDGILTDEDREKIIATGLTIAPSSKTRLLDEEFIAYRHLQHRRIAYI